MNMSLSDVADRYSICKLKKIHGYDVDREMRILLDELLNHKGILNHVNDLIAVNKRIWDLESDIRTYKENELGLEEVGRRAIMIRNINDERIAIKNKIVDIYDSGFKEAKLITKFGEE